MQRACKAHLNFIFSSLRGSLSFCLTSAQHVVRSPVWLTLAHRCGMQLEEMRKNEDPRLSFSTPEFKEAQRIFTDGLKVL